MLKIKEIVDENQKESYEAYFQNELISDAILSKSHTFEGKFDIRLNNNEFVSKILSLNTESIELIYENVSSIDINEILEFLDSKYFNSYLNVRFQKVTNNYSFCSFYFTIGSNWFDWDLPFSINTYATTFVDYWEEYDFPYDIETFAEPYDLSLTISFEIENIKSSLIDEIKVAKSLIKDCHEKTLDFLKTDSSDLFITAFNFPKELKVPCKQYLEYFAKFLQDLGINATSNLKEEAGKVLFSVTPTDDVEALDKIREALAVYLNLPSSPIIYDDSFAAMRLKQQVDNLQHAQRMTEMEVRSSQYALRLANQTIEHQDKIIQQKDTTIEQQNKIIERVTDKAIMINSAENKEELEEIFDGVKVGKSKFLAEQLGLHLNPAAAIKSVGKKIIGGDNDIISLDLDKED